MWKKETETSHQERNFLSFSAVFPPFRFSDAVVCWQYAFSSARPPTSTDYGNFTSRLLHTMLILEGLLIDFFHLAIFHRSTFRQLRWLILMTACNGPCHDTLHCATHDLLRHDSLKRSFFFVHPQWYLFFIKVVSQLSVVDTLHATEDLEQNFLNLQPYS